MEKLIRPKKINNLDLQRRYETTIVKLAVEAGHVTEAAIARRTGLSTETVHFITQQLKDATNSKHLINVHHHLRVTLEPVAISFPTHESLLIKDTDDPEFVAGLMKEVFNRGWRKALVRELGKDD